MFNSASNYADSVDIAMLIIVGISVVLLLGITVAMIYFVFRYNRKRHPVAEQIHGNILMEVIWIVVPTILVMVMFWYGYEGYQKLRADVDDAYEVKVFAYMWGWNFEYPNGKKTDTLYLPLSKKTKLILTSRDVNHSFYVPAFRLKEDVIGGREHYMILKPKTTGSYDVACAEYCGLNHSMMYTKLHVLEDFAFDKWVNMTDDGNTSPELVPTAEEPVNEK
ncbi:MAG: cytochrome c oxidase subunit II [Candidatus Kapaibacterium sp.]|jgi:cytochrome c oxidase subunit 2